MDDVVESDYSPNTTSPTISRDSAKRLMQVFHDKTITTNTASEDNDQTLDSTDEEKKTDNGESLVRQSTDTLTMNSMGGVDVRNAYASLDAPSADVGMLMTGDHEESLSVSDVGSSPVNDDLPRKDSVSEEDEEGKDGHSSQEEDGEVLPSFAELVANSYFVDVDDQELAPDSFLISLAQLVPCKATEQDRKGVYRNLPDGFQGLCCRWCGGQPSKGRYFPSKESNAGRIDTHNAMIKHFLTVCRYCPPPIVKAIQTYQKGPNRSYGNRQEHAQRLWQRIESAVPVEAEDLFVHPENRLQAYAPVVEQKTKQKLQRPAGTSVSKHWFSTESDGDLGRRRGPGRPRKSDAAVTSAETLADASSSRIRKRKIVEETSGDALAPKKRAKDDGPVTINTRPTLKSNLEYYVEEFAHWEHNPPFPFTLQKDSPVQTEEAASGEAPNHLLTPQSGPTESTTDGMSTSSPNESKLVDEQGLEDDPVKAGFQSKAVVMDKNPDPLDIDLYGVAPEDLPKIPGPPPIPALPNTGKCKWSYDANTRVLIADFSNSNDSWSTSFTMHPEDSEFFFKMMEKDDITLISRGMLNYSKMKPELWNTDYMGERLQGDYHHKFRRFDRVVDENGIESFKEVDKMYSMCVDDYVRYSRMRASHMKDLGSGSGSGSEAVEEPTFTFVDAENKEHTLGVGTTALYMIDVDIKRLMPWMYENFQESFNLPAVLPGGSHCMMNPVTPEGRPFMGPNLYVTPPASFTHFHQDGHGTVDSGHLVISGYNEVIMLRRLPERHKKHALWILTGKKPDKTWWDGLYAEPHGDGLGDKPSWPTADMIADCENMGYCPTVCILEPGDLIHINKGRLHAFRKMSTMPLPSTDCHSELRSGLIARKDLRGEHRCVSVAWDWMYRGVTSEGINREVCTVLEATVLNQKHGVVSLAIPEFSLLHMAKEAVSPKAVDPFGPGSFLRSLPHCMEVTNALSLKSSDLFNASREDICRGILPCLRYVVRGHEASLSAATNDKKDALGRGERLLVEAKPDTQPNPALNPLDPLGNDGFACRLCSKELSNVYYHCYGCETLLSKDYNICKDCYADKKFMIKEQMHPTNPKRHATLNHTGDLHQNRQSRCPCKNGPVCGQCGWCLGCSCRCHTWFTMHTRLIDKETELSLLRRVEDVAGVSSKINSPSPNWSLPVESTSKEFDVDTMTTLANERFADAKYGPRIMIVD